MSATFKKPALNIASVIASLFKPKYAEQNQTKWIKELVENGTFNDNVDSWEVLNGTIDHDTGGDGGRIELTGTGTSNVRSFKSIGILLEGQTYYCSADFVDGTGSSKFIRISSGDTLPNSGDWQQTEGVDTSGSITMNFVPSATQEYYFGVMGSSTATETEYFDNISVRESMPEKVQNGTFDSDTSGWVDSGTSILSVTSGQMTIDRNGEASPYIVCTQVLSCDIGKTYLVTLDLVDDGANNLFNVAISGTEIITSATQGALSVIFVAETSTPILQMVPAGATTNTAIVDNISVKEISYELPHNAEVQAVSAAGLRLTDVDAYNIFDDGFNKTVNFTDDAVLAQDIAIDYRVRL